MFWQYFWRCFEDLYFISYKVKILPSLIFFAIWHLCYISVSFWIIKNPAMNKLKCDLQWKEKRVYWWFTYYICLPLTETWLVQTTSITTINRIFEKGGGGSLSYHDILSQDFTIFMVKQKKSCDEFSVVNRIHTSPPIFRYSHVHVIAGSPSQHFWDQAKYCKRKSGN